MIEPASGSSPLRETSRNSVFAKLLAIMLIMAASLLLLVGGFFWLIVNPNLNASIGRVVGEQVRSIAAEAPDREAARRIADRLNIYIRYDGPGGSWTTADFLPPPQSARAWDAEPWWRRPARLHQDYVVPAPDGGTYVMAWSLGARMHLVHVSLVWLLLFVMVAVILIAHAVLRRLLRPVRALADAVARVGDGQLDVMVPSSTQDEFGTLTDAFNEMVRRVGAMVRARDQLLLDVSHELRSPLTRLKVALELLPDSAKKSRMVADIAEMDAMVGELLELERLRDGRGLRIQRHDLVTLLREETARFADRQPGVHLAPVAQDIATDFDSEKIRTVLRNLLENAFKYSLADSRPVEICAQAGGDVITVEVVDDGPGIPAADAQNLFEPFFRIDRSRSKRTGGYGLGLSICKRIMEAHGGGITVRNNPLRGSTFTLTLRAGG